MRARPAGNELEHYVANEDAEILNRWWDEKFNAIFVEQFERAMRERWIDAIGDVIRDTQSELRNEIEALKRRVEEQNITIAELRG